MNALERAAALAAVMGSRPDPRPVWLLGLPLVGSPSLYYRLMYELAAELRPRLALEVGTYDGAGACHLAAGCPETRVVTVDVDPAASERCRAAAAAGGLRNVEAVTLRSDAPELLELLAARGPVDLLFVDGDHSYEAALGDYRRLLPLCRPGALVLLDDVDLDDGMRRFWSEVAEPKRALPGMHYMGFGAALAV